MYDLVAYSSRQYKDDSTSDLPIILTVAVSAVFALVAFTFYCYDRFVKCRNNIVIDATARSNAILMSLFPKQVRDRLFAERDEEENKGDDFGKASPDGFTKRTAHANDRPNADLVGHR